jgi:putative tryptophan/tyrosine transport system substrate-binding protein
VTLTTGVEDTIQKLVELLIFAVPKLNIFLDAFLFQQRTQFARLALKHRLPSICQLSQFPETGGLMSYRSDLADDFRRTGVFVEKILKGAKPGDIPIEQPTRYSLVKGRPASVDTPMRLN